MAAVNNLEAILDVPGTDGIFAGPNDMSVSLASPTTATEGFRAEFGHLRAGAG